MKYYVIAGEASGDLHGANLMKGLYAEDPEADIRFWGGAQMEAVFKASQRGRGLVRDYADGAVIGFSQVILHFRAFAEKFRFCRSDILGWGPDVVILIDYPGFNFRVAEFAHRQGFKVFWYIAPKVWASREGRIRKLKAFVDRLFIVFPFERDYFTRKGVPFIYKGNPLIDAVDTSPALSESREAFFSRVGLGPSRYIAILAGSRRGEVNSMMPVCADFADRMHAMPQYSGWHFIVAGAPSRCADDYAQWLRGREGYMHLLFGESYAVLRHAQAAVVNSGTASLEAALIGTPQVVAYASAELNFRVGKLILKTDHISLGNLILGRTCFRELLQHYFTAENTLDEVRRLIEDGEYRAEMLSGYGEIRDALGGRGASNAVARSMTEELKKMKLQCGH